MLDREQAIAELRDEFWDLVFETRRQRHPDLIDRDQRRMVTIRAALAAFGTHVGPRPADLPPDEA